MIGGKEVCAHIKDIFTPKIIMALTQKEISARIYKNRKGSGLCPRCGKQLDRAGHYCIECLKKVNDYNRETREFCKEHHICTMCRKEVVYGTDRICFECRAKKSENRKPLTEDQKKRYGETFRKQQKTLYQQRSEGGICVRCGKRKAAEGKKRCAICLEKDTYAHKKKRMDGLDVKEYRRKNHLCYYCGEPVDLPKGQLCSSCMERCKENGRKGRAINNYWKQDNMNVFKKVGTKI